MYRLIVLVAAILTWVVAPGAFGAPITVSGAVRTPDGAPLAAVDVKLLALQSNYQWARMVLDEERAVPPPLAVGKTNAAGRFSLEVPEAGIRRVVVDRAGLVPMRFMVLPAAHATVLPPVALLADEGTRIAVRWRSGAPAAGVWVYAQTASESVWEGVAAGGWQVGARVGRSDDGGRLVLPRAAGEELELSAYLPGTTRLGRTTAGRQATLTLAPMSPSGAMAVGAEGGQPIPGVLIATGDPPWPAGRTDEDGRLAVAGPLPAGLPLYLFAADGRRSRELLAAPGGGEDGLVRLVLPRAQPLTGQVAAAQTGRPVAGAVVWPVHDPGTFVLTDAQGGYQLVAALAEGFRVRADASGFLPAVEQVRRSERGATRVPTLALVTAAGVGGQVVDATGAPVADAELAASFLAPRPPPFYPDPLLGRATTDATGRFFLANLHPHGVYELKVQKAGYATAWREFGVGGQTRGLRIRLEAARPVHGLVIDTEERPVAGAEVKLAAARSLGPRRERPLTTASDEKGRFEFPRAPAAKLDLLGRKRGFSPLIVRGIDVPAGTDPIDLGVLVLEAGAAVHGTVADGDGEPIAETRVWAVEDTGRSLHALTRMLRDEPAHAVSDGQGTFQIVDLRRGRNYHLFFNHPEYLPAEVPGVEVPTRAAIEVVLEPASTVRGRVVDEDDEPIAGAQVNLEREALTPGEVVPAPGPESDATVVTDERGRFAFGQVRPGKARVGASARGYQPAPPIPIEIAENDSIDDLKFVLERGAEVAGRVTNRDDEPVAGCRIHGGRASGESDAGGFYRLTGVPPGRLRLEARHPGYNRLRREITVEPGENRADLVLTGGWPVAGRVIDEEGLPVARAEVLLRHFADGRYREYRATTGEEGRFALDRVAEGRCELAAEKDGYAPGRREGDFVVGGGPVDDLEVILRRGATISGQILGLEFDELARVKVRAEREDAGKDGSVDYDGAYRIADLAPGDWLVKARLPGGRRQAEVRVVIAPGIRSLFRDLDFGGGLTLFGRVLYGGEPLSDAKVTATGRDVTTTRTVTTDHEGGYRIADLEPGRYRVSLSSPRELLLYNEDVELTGDRQLDVEVATAAIRGVIVSEATLQPVPEATVSLLQLLAPDGSQTGSRVTLSADRAGAFHLARLTAGRHRLSVHKEGYEPHEEILEFAAGEQIHGLEIALTPAAGLELVVRLASGAVPSFVTVGIFDPGGRLLQTESARPSVGGRARFSTIPAGSWTLRVTAAGGSAAGIAATVPGPAPEVVLAPTGGLRVRVPALVESNLAASLTIAGEDGQPFTVLEPSGVLVGEWSLRGGVGLVAGLPAGAWTLRVVAADGRWWEKTIATTGMGELETSLE